VFSWLGEQQNAINKRGLHDLREVTSMSFLIKKNHGDGKGGGGSERDEEGLGNIMI
jgi:hypothetical protein